MSSSIAWTDAEGVASLSNLKTGPGARLFNWSPDSFPVGPTVTGLGTGTLHHFNFRDDYYVSFEMRGIPGSEAAKLLRLQTHLIDGYLVALTCDREMAATFAICCLAPDSKPDITFGDRTRLEYTLAVRLKAVAAADVPVDEPYYPPGG